MQNTVRYMRFGKGADCAAVAMLVNEALSVTHIKRTLFTRMRPHKHTHTHTHTHTLHANINQIQNQTRQYKHTDTHKIQFNLIYMAQNDIIVSRRFTESRA